MKRSKAIETINDLPTDFDLDVLIERLVFIEKVEKGLVQLQNREVFTHDEVRQKVREWQK
jgi:hypothetical protein